MLDEYLFEIDNQACERFSRIVEQMKQAQVMTEQLKEDNSIEWIKRMNCLRQQADETVLRELIYA